jgi:hypothetical protein
MCRGAPIGSANETVAFEAAEIAPDGHLRDLEVARERPDLYSLVLRDPLQDLKATLDG